MLKNLTQKNSLFFKLVRNTGVNLYVLILVWLFSFQVFVQELFCIHLPENQVDD